jgi:hypothetical protein
MRRIIFAVVLSFASIAHAADKPNPADFNVTVHVIGSVWQPPAQWLVATVAGQRVILGSDGSISGLLPLGDYKAQATVRPPDKNNPPYDLQESFKLLLPDGKTRGYHLCAMGDTAGVPR